MREFGSWPRELYPGALDLLTCLRGQAELACLSNTNALHWEMLCDVHALGEHFDRCLLSHRLGLLKPDPAIFERALDELGCSASEVSFFDDGPGHVAEALRQGFDAEQVDGLDGLRQALERRGWGTSPSGTP